MTLRIEDGIVYLEGACAVEEAELLVAAFESGGAAAVDLANCRHLHCAVVQTLLRFKPSVRGVSKAPFIRDFVAPAMQSAAADL